MRRAGLLFLLLAAVPSLAAQEGAVARTDADRAGPYAYVGVGSAGVRETCASCPETTDRGIGLRAGFGWAIVPAVSIEATVEGTRRADDQLRERTVYLMVGARIRVLPRLALRVAAGSAELHQEVPTATTTYEYTDQGLGWAAGVEYLQPLGRSVVIAPFVSVRGMATGELERDGTVVATDHTFRSVETGVALRWHLRSLILPGRWNPRPE